MHVSHFSFFFPSFQFCLKEKREKSGQIQAKATQLQQQLEQHQAAVCQVVLSFLSVLHFEISEMDKLTMQS